MNILIEIPARGGSKGVPCKALRDIGGMPLIAYTILDALKIKGKTRVVVNTDDKDIREVALDYGAEVPFLRPKRLAGDKSNLDDVVAFSRKWLLENENYSQDIYIIMSPTNPFRRETIVNKALECGLNDKSMFNIGSVAPVSNDSNNYWIKDNGALIRFPGVINPEGKKSKLCQSSMSFNIVFDCRSEFTEDLHTPVMLNNIEAIDIDDVCDLELARDIVRNRFYPLPENSESSKINGAVVGCYICGKRFEQMKISNKDKYYKHKDFCIVSEAEFSQFKDYCKRGKKPIITGSKSIVHPYRLRFIDNRGYSRFLYDVEMEVRGNRQSYPDVFSFVPAMVYIPGGFDPRSVNLQHVEMFEMDSSKLIDSSVFPDGVVI